MLTVFHHVRLAMPRGGEARARAFYVDPPGLEPVEKPPARAGRGRTWFERGTLRVHLEVEDPIRAARKAHPAFLVDALDALRARFDAAGRPHATDADLPGHDRCFADAPFGNRIGFLASQTTDATTSRL